MAIYKRGYSGYAGPITQQRWRFLILSRYAWQSLFRSRLLTAFFVACFFYPLGALAAIYLNANASLFSLLRLPGSPITIGGTFFDTFLNVQGTLAFFMATFAGPGLVAPDLANNALPLYFGRPFSRAEYVLGKMTVLFGLLSLVTWIPGLLLFAAAWGVGAHGWLGQNLWLAKGIVVGSVFWIVILSLLALALSAWVKWKIAAAGLMLGLLFLGSGFGHAVNSVLGTTQGALLDIGNLIRIVWDGLFLVDSDRALPTAEAWVMLTLIGAACLGLLSMKLRAHEVVK